MVLLANAIGVSCIVVPKEKKNRRVKTAGLSAFLLLTDQQWSRTDEYDSPSFVTELWSGCIHFSGSGSQT